jgi:putative tryptophan/tyrosine transport system substrate-binding protein
MRRRNVLGMTAIAPRMRRRAILLGALTTPFAAAARQGDAVARIGVLLFSSPAQDVNLPALLRGLRELGYEEGRNLAVDYLYAEGRAERLPDLAAHMATKRPELVVAFGGDVAKAAAATIRTLPIVILSSNDPVRAGLVESLRRPGRNVTGATLLADELAAKRIELLRELAPETLRVGLVLNPEHEDDDLAETERATRSLGLALTTFELRRPTDLAGVLEGATKADVDAIVVVASRLTNVLAPRILAFAAERRRPVVAGWKFWAQRGALAAYGPNIDESAGRLAVFVDKILRGARPGDIPVEQPSRFELTLNAGVARRLGIGLSPHVLARADEVIE